MNDATRCLHVIERLKQGVAAGTWAAGDAFPSERDLAARLRVSRASVREALRTLAVMGVVQTRQGSGTRLATEGANVLATAFEFLMLVDRPTIAQLIDARRLIEVRIAELAAERRSDADLARLEVALVDLAEEMDQASPTNKANVRFHLALADAAGNPVLKRIMECLHQRVEALMAVSSRGVRDWRYAWTVHRDIVAAVRRRDVQAARAVMSEHFAAGAADAARVVSPQAPAPAVRRARKRRG